MYYIINSRQNAAYLQSVGTVNGVQGQILLPDAWILPQGVTFMGSASGYDINTYNLEEWEIMEEASERAYEAVKMILAEDVDAAMNGFNQKKHSDMNA